MYVYSINSPSLLWSLFNVKPKLRSLDPSSPRSGSPSLIRSHPPKPKHPENDHIQPVISPKLVPRLPQPIVRIPSCLSSALAHMSFHSHPVHRSVRDSRLTRLNWNSTSSRSNSRQALSCLFQNSNGSRSILESATRKRPKYQCPSMKSWSNADALHVSNDTQHAIRPPSAPKGSDKRGEMRCIESSSRW